MLDNLSEKFKVNILSRTVSKVIPNSLNLFTTQFNFHFVFIESVLYFFEPIHTICVSKKLTLRPEMFTYCSSSCNVSLRNSSEPSNMTVVSSAYCVKIKSVLLIFILFIFSFFLIFIAKISAQSINMYGETGSPLFKATFSVKTWGKITTLIYSNLCIIIKYWYPLNDRMTKIKWN